MCVKTWHLPSQVGNAYECSNLWIMRGIKNCVSFPWCYCSDTLLGVWPPAELDFQSLDENPHPWWLSHPYYYTWQEHFFITGAVPCHSAILYQVSHTLSHSLKWYRRYLSIRIRENLWFSHFPFYQFCWKIVSCCFLEWKQSKFAWYHMKVGYLGDFSHEGPSVGDSLSAGLFLVLLVESQMRPQIQRWSLSLCVTYS